MDMRTSKVIFDDSSWTMRNMSRNARGAIPQCATPSPLSPGAPPCGPSIVCVLPDPVYEYPPCVCVCVCVVCVYMSATP